MVGKMANVTWLEGAFVETIKGWQSGWFYITEPRDPKWATAPEIRSGIPTPGPHERVVFLPHFLHGLGFPLHPFVRGLMFYYGLDFHVLAPNFILNISAFIIVGEAFFRIQPHFGLWLKIFSIKPKVVKGRQAECRGAMVGKMANVTWLEGAFV